MSSASTSGESGGTVKYVREALANYQHQGEPQLNDLQVRLPGQPTWEGPFEPKKLKKVLQEIGPMIKRSAFCVYPETEFVDHGDFFHNPNSFKKIAGLSVDGGEMRQKIEDMANALVAKGLEEDEAYGCAGVLVSNAFSLTLLKNLSLDRFEAAEKNLKAIGIALGEIETIRSLAIDTSAPKRPKEDSDQQGEVNDEPKKSLEEIISNFFSIRHWPLLESVVLGVFESKHQWINDLQLPSLPKRADIFFSHFYETDTDPQNLNKIGSNDILILFGPSGCGKTKSIYRYLRKEFGFFLNFKTSGDKNHGSTALANITNMVKKEIEEKSPYNPEGITNDTADAKRRKIAEMGIACVIASYMTIFLRWNDYLNQNSEILMPEAWLLVQLFPVEYFGGDIFLSLASDLFSWYSKDESNFNKIWDYSKSLVPLCDNLAFKLKGGCPPRVIIDEAQLAANILPNAFYTSTSGDLAKRNSLGRRSIIGPYLDFLQIFARNPLISGTGISLLSIYKTFEPVYGIANANQNNYLYVDYPALESEDIKVLLKKFLGDDFDETGLNINYDILAGRPRYLFQVLGMWLGAVELKKNMIEIFNIILHSYVNEQTEIRKMEGQPRGPGESIFKGLERPIKLNIQNGEYNSMLQFLINSFNISCGEEPQEQTSLHVDLVEFGLAYANRRANSTNDSSSVPAQIKIEPLVLIAAQKARGDETDPEKFDQFLINQILAPSSSDAVKFGFAFEFAAAFKFRSFLNGKDFEACLNQLRGMENVKNLYYPHIYILNDTAGGIEFAESKLPDEYKGKWKQLDPYNGMYCPPNSKKIKKNEEEIGNEIKNEIENGGCDTGPYDWMNSILDGHSPVFPMYFPTNQCGPDTILAFKNNGKILFVLILDKFAKDVDFQDAAATVDPMQFNCVNRAPTKADIDNYPKKIAKHNEILKKNYDEKMKKFCETNGKEPEKPVYKPANFPITHPINDRYKALNEQLNKKLKEKGALVMRVIISGKCLIKETRVGKGNTSISLPRTMLVGNGRGGYDLLVLICGEEKITESSFLLMVQKDIPENLSFVFGDQLKNKFMNFT